MCIRDSVRIVCDSKLRIPPGSQIVKSAEKYRTIVAYADQKNTEEKIKILHTMGVETIYCPDEKDQIDLKKLMTDLGNRGIDSILLEGGGTLNDSALRAGIVKEVQAFVAPKLFGGVAGKTPVEGIGVEFPSEACLLYTSKKILTDQKLDSSIYITLDTLKYLKKGGRITPAAAAIGTVLNLKPVLQIQGEKLDAYAKVRGKKQAKRAMLKAMKNDWETRFKEYVSDGEMCLQAAYTGNLEEAEEFKREIQEVFPGMEIHMDPLSLSVACHIGYGALAVACSRKVTL